MQSFQHPSAESRLLGYTLQDFGDPTKYNRRTAQANSQRQIAQHQAQLDLNQRTGQTVGAGMEMAEPVKANQQLSNAQNVYANAEAGAGSQVNYDSAGRQTGAISLSGIGATDENLIERLRGYGMPDSQIREVLKDPARIASIRETMSNTGMAQLTPEEQKRQARDAEIASIPQTKDIQVGVDKSGRPVYMTVSDPDYGKNVANVKNRFAQEDYTTTKTKEFAQGRQASNVAGDQATQQSEQKKQESITEEGALAKAIRKATKEIPGAGLYTATLATLEQQKAKDLATIEAQKALGLLSAEQAFNSSKAYRDKVKTRRTELFEEAKEEAKRQNEENMEILQDRERVQREANRNNLLTETRNLEKQKTKQVLQETIALALRGGWGSSAGNDAVLETERQWDTAIADLNRQYNFKDQEIMSFYTDKYTQENQAYRSDIRTATQNYYNALDAIDQSFYDSDTKYKQAQNTILSNYMQAVSDAGKTYSSGLTELVKTASSQIAELTKANKKEAMSTKDTLGYVAGLRKEADGKQIIKDSKEIDLRFSLMTTALSDFKSGKQKTATAVDQALITIYNKMLDPSSVVRESEYARTPSDLSLLERVKGAGAKQFFSGGAGLTNEVREDLVAMAERFKETYDDKLATEMQPFILDIDKWNAAYPESPISYSQVFDVNGVHLPSQTIERWSNQANDGTIVSRSGLNASSTLVDFFSVYAPSADNNNPTGYAQAVASDLGVTPSTPIGELAGKVDAFAKAIAKHEGFTSGASRLAVVNNNPGNLRFIGQAGATQGEGGFARFATVEDGYRALKNDILAKIGTGNTTIASAPKGSTAYSLVPTANAESPDDVIYISDDEQTTSMPELEQRTISVGSSNNPMDIKIEKIQYRNKKTGEIVNTVKGNDKFYSDRPYVFEIVGAEPSAKKTKPLVLAGKPLPN